MLRDKDFFDMIMNLFQRKISLEVHEYDDKYILVGDISDLGQDDLFAEYIVDGGRPVLALLDKTGTVYVTWDFPAGKEVISSKVTNGIIEIIIRR